MSSCRRLRSLLFLQLSFYTLPHFAANTKVSSVICPVCFKSSHQNIYIKSLPCSLNIWLATSVADSFEIEICLANLLVTGRGADPPPPSKCRGHERVELYLYSPSGPQWPVIGRTFTFTLLVKLSHFNLFLISRLLNRSNIRRIKTAGESFQNVTAFIRFRDDSNK